MGEAHPSHPELYRSTEEMHEDAGTRPTYENVHPESLEERIPETFAWFIYTTIDFVSAYGWFLLLFSFLAYYIWNKLRPKYDGWQEASDQHKNPDKFLAREFAISEARKRLQERYDSEASAIAAKREENKERENERIRSNVRQSESSSRPGAASSQTSIDKSCKPRLRPAYNPLMGDTSSRGWSRPSGRRSGGG